MSASENYNSNGEDQTDRQAQRQRRYSIDTALNWLFLCLVAFIGVWIIETDIDTYQSEKPYMRMVNDGITADQVPDEYTKRGLERNLPNKGMAPGDFFVLKWKWRVLVYLGCIFIPLLVGFLRVISKDRIRWNWAYFPMILVSISYGIYFWGRWTNLW